MKSPQIAVSHTTSIPEEVFAEFRKLVATENLDFQIKSREEGAMFATIEWLIPTAVIIYIGKSYFDSFLKEMGKDHYVLLKAGLKTLRDKFLGPTAPEITIISTEGKSFSNQPYSLLYSIMAEANSGVNFKLLLQRDVTAEEYEEIIASFLAFLLAYHSDKLDAGCMERMQQARVVGRTLLLSFNRDSKCIEPIDPIPSRSENET
jgi:hypothetical protein